MYAVSKGDQSFCCPFLFSSKCIKEHFIFQCTLNVRDPIRFPIITQTKGSFCLLIPWLKYILDEHLFGLVLLQKAVNHISAFGFTFANPGLKIYTNVLGKICVERVNKTLFSNFSRYFSGVCIQDKYSFCITRNNTKCSHEKQESLCRPWRWAFATYAVTAWGCGFRVVWVGASTVGVQFNCFS